MAELSGYLGFDPGPWTFGQLLSAADGRRRALKEQAAQVWVMGFGDGSGGTGKRVQMLPPSEAGRVLNMAFK